MASSQHRIYLEIGKVGDQDVWFLIKVSKIKSILYLKHSKHSKIGLKKYGEIIQAGIGKHPSQKCLKEYIERK